MKVLITKEATEQFATLSDTAKRSAIALINQLEGAGWVDLLRSGLVQQVPSVGESMYLLTVERGVALLASLETVGSETQLLLVGVIQQPAKFTPSFGSRFGRLPRYNPAIDGTISPIYNTTLNPIYNTTINPIYNSSISPIYNTTLNPIYNTLINPNYNTLINPNYNTSLNPAYNTLINPAYNLSFAGPFIYDLKGKVTGYLVKANDTVTLVFGMGGAYAGLVVKANETVELQFNKGLVWTGQLIADGRGGRLIFDKANKWVGFAN